jgi:hypothetical protein
VTQNRAELSAIRQRIKTLTPEEQLMLAEGILADIRRAHFTDHEADRKAWDERLKDPDFQRVLNNEDLPYPGAELNEAG